jgi:hypothetical protein
MMIASSTRCAKNGTGSRHAPEWGPSCNADLVVTTPGQTAPRSNRDSKDQAPSFRIALQTDQNVVLISVQPAIPLDCCGGANRHCLRFLNLFGGFPFIVIGTFDDTGGFAAERAQIIKF